MCIRLNKKVETLQAAAPEIKYLKEQIEEMCNILTDFEEECSVTHLSAEEIAHDIQVFYETLKSAANIEQF